jgi:hypothetical protein
MINKEEALKRVQEAIAECTVENTPYAAVIVIVNNEKNTVRVYGMNIDESEVPLLLVEAAGEVGEKHLEDMKRRTLQ